MRCALCLRARSSRLLRDSRARALSQGAALGCIITPLQGLLYFRALSQGAALGCIITPLQAYFKPRIPKSRYPDTPIPRYHGLRTFDV
jgi:hypothetical protein